MRHGDMIKTAVALVADHNGAPIGTRGLEIPEGYKRQSIFQALQRAATEPERFGIVRVSPGVYRYDPSVIGTRIDNNPELAAIVDNIPPSRFHDAGLNLLARTADRAYLCLDEQGTAWKVEVTVTARLV